MSSSFIRVQVFEELSGDFMVDVIKVVDDLLASGKKAHSPMHSVWCTGINAGPLLLRPVCTLASFLQRL